jgi:hypothetical protein
MALTSTGVSPAGAIPGGGSTMVTAASPGSGDGEMMFSAALGAGFSAAAPGSGSKMALALPGVGPATAIPGGGSNMVLGALGVDFSATSLESGDGEMKFSAASGSRAFAPAAALGGGGAVVLAVPGTRIVDREALRPSRWLACNSAMVAGRGMGVLNYAITKQGRRV